MPSNEALEAKRERLRKALQKKMAQPIEAPLTFGQRRLWFVDQLDPGNPLYNITFSFLATGDFRYELYQRALEWMIKRHESLRTTIELVAGEPVQRIHPAADSQVNIQTYDYEQLEGTNRDERISNFIVQQNLTRMDLAQGPLIKNSFVRISEHETIGCVTMHHAISDGWSIGILLSELSIAYTQLSQGLPITLDPLPCRYRDFAQQQLETLSGESLERLLDFWTRRLDQAPHFLDLPTDHPRPQQLTHEGTVFRFLIPQRLLQPLEQLGRDSGTTLFATTLAAYASLLYRYSHQSDMLIGIPISGRERPDIQSLIGYFVNMVPERVTIKPDTTFRQLVETLRDSTAETFAHQDVPFDRLVEALAPKRASDRNPLVQVVYLYQNFPSFTEHSSKNLEIERLEIHPGFSRFEIGLRAEKCETGLACWIEYNTDLFDEVTIEQFSLQLRRLIENVVQDPDQPIDSIRLTDNTPTRQTRTESPPQHSSLHQWLDQTVAQHPDGLVYIDDSGNRLVYRQLQQATLRFANWLNQSSGNADQHVALVGDLSIETLIGILGTSRAGYSFSLVGQHECNQWSLRPLHQRKNLRWVAAGRLDASLPQTIDLEPFPLEIFSVSQSDDHLPIDDSNRGTDPDRVVLRIADGQSAESLTEVASWQLSLALKSACDVCGLQTDERWLVADSPSVVQRVIGGLAPVLAGAQIDFIGSHRADYEPDTIIVDLPQAADQLGSLDAAKVTDCRLIVRDGFGAHGSLAEVVELCQPAKLMQTFLFPELPELLFAYEVDPVPKFGDDRETAASAAVQCLGQPVIPDLVQIVDRHGQTLPSGIPGRLAVATDLPDAPPRCSSGDLIRQRHDGLFEYLGRTDDIVRVGSALLDLKQIEQELLSCDQVKECFLIDLSGGDPSSQPSLTVYIVPQGETAPDRQQLIGFLQSRIPRAWIPAEFLLVTAIPRTASGDVAVSELPRSTRTRPSPVHSAAHSETEKRLIKIWQETLQVEQIDRDDDFFSLGGNSLLAMQLVERTQRDFQVALDLHTAFQNPTVANIARLIDAGDPAEQSNAVIPTAATDQPKVLSNSQFMLWMIEQFDQGIAFNVPVQLQIAGPLDIDGLEQALTSIADRHQILRSAINSNNGNPVHQVLANRPVKLDVVDISNLEVDQQPTETMRLATDLTNQSFDLEQGFLIRYRLIRLNQTSHVLVIAMHHLVSDGWSFGLLVNELVEFYEAGQQSRRARVPDLSIQFSDFAIWQRKRSEDSESDGYWQSRIASQLPVLDLPTDFPRGTEMAVEPEVCDFEVPPNLVESLERISRSQGTSLFATLLSAYFVLLHRYSTQNDLVIGSATANRDPQTRDLIGFFASLLPIRCELESDSSFLDLMQQVHETCRVALTAVEPTLNELTQMMMPAGHGRMPICQALFTFAEFPNEPIDKGGLQWQPSNLNIVRFTGFDLVLTLARAGDQLNGAFLFRPDLFTHETIERLQRSWQMLLKSIVRNPAQTIAGLPILSETDRKQMLADWNATTAPFPSTRCLHELFESAANQYADSIAIIDLERHVTYQELNEYADRIAGYLQTRNRDLVSQPIVGVLMEKSSQLIATLLGILKSGAAYLPLDPNWPTERIDTVINSASCRQLIIDQNDDRESTWKHLANTNPLVSLDTILDAEAPSRKTSPSSTPSDLAYVIFTSGSTGTPKGVMIEHHSVVNVAHSFAKTYQLGPQDRVLQQASIAFDVSVNEIFPILISGGALVIPPRNAADFGETIECVKREHVTIMGATPTGLSELNRQADSIDSLRLILSGGEQLSESHIDRLLSMATVTNGYGPTEATICATFFNLNQRPEGNPTSIPIGKPLPNYRVYVVDSQLNPVPIGVPGELCIAGEGLARGYLNDPDLTDQKFIDNPFEAGQRLYRTGDEARWLADGNLEFMGRIDRQVKIRGFRIELGEIENALNRLPQVKHAVVLVDRKPAQLDRIVAYLQLEPDQPNLQPAALRRELSAQLPEYMLPSVYMTVESFPLTANGKVDLKSLPAPIATRPDLDVEFSPPETELEQDLAAIWCDLLGLDRIGRNDNFFDLGGHSILAAQIIYRIQQQFQTSLPYQAFFDSPTIADVCELLAQCQSGSDRDDEHRSDLKLNLNYQDNVSFREITVSRGSISVRVATLGPFETNTYLVVCKETNQAILIDPAWNGNELADYLQSEQLQLNHMLLTHAHVDHFAGVTELKRRQSAILAAHHACQEPLASGHLQGRFFNLNLGPLPELDQLLNDGDEICVGKLTVTALETPGHSEGHCCFHIPSAGVVFVGDLITNGQPGHADLPGGDRDSLIESLNQKILTLPESTIVLPGHGSATTVSSIKRDAPGILGGA